MVTVFIQPAEGADGGIGVVDEEDGVFRADGLEEVHHEFFLAGPGVDEKEVDFGGVEAVVAGSAVDFFAT